MQSYRRKDTQTDNQTDRKICKIIQTDSYTYIQTDGHTYREKDIHIYIQTVCMYACISVYMCLSVCQSISLSVCLSVCPSVRLLFPKQDTLSAPLRLNEVEEVTGPSACIQRPVQRRRSDGIRIDDEQRDSWSDPVPQQESIQSASGHLQCPSVIHWRRRQLNGPLQLKWTPGISDSVSSSTGSWTECWMSGAGVYRKSPMPGWMSKDRERRNWSAVQLTMKLSFSNRSSDYLFSVLCASICLSLSLCLRLAMSLRFISVSLCMSLCLCLFLRSLATPKTRTLFLVNSKTSCVDGYHNIIVIVNSRIRQRYSLNASEVHQLIQYSRALLIHCISRGVAGRCKKESWYSVSNCGRRGVGSNYCQGKILHMPPYPNEQWVHWSHTEVEKTRERTGHPLCSSPYLHSSSKQNNIRI